MRMIILSAAVCAATVFGAHVANAADARYVRGPTVGCFDRDIMRRVQDLRDDDNGLAARALMHDAIASGVCRPVAPGMLVRVDDDDILAGLSKIRADGRRIAIWVRSDALTDD